MVEQQEYQVETIKGGVELLTLFDTSKSGALANHNFTIYFSDESKEQGTTDENGQYKIQKDLKTGQTTVDSIEVSGPTANSPFTEDSTDEDSSLEDVDAVEDADSDAEEYDITETTGPEMTTVEPQKAPVEGGTRVKISGSGFTEECIVKVGGDEATDVRLNEDGTAIYATLPPASAGVKDLTVNTPGQEDAVLPQALTYVENLSDTVQAAVASYVVYLTEIRDLARTLADSEELDSEIREQLGFETDYAGTVTHDAIEVRSSKVEEQLSESEVQDPWKGQYSTLTSLTREIYDVLGLERSKV